MSAQQLADRIEATISESIEAFGISVESFQGTLNNKIVSLLKDLELDSDGYIKQSSLNRRILYDAENLIYEMLPGTKFSSVVTEALTVIPALDVLNSNYFEALSDSFKTNRTFLKTLQTQAIKQVESTLLQDGLTMMIRNPLINILYQNVNSGGQFSGLLQQVRDFITGNEDVEGRIYSYSRTYLSDTLFDYSRAFQQSVTADLALEWYSYSGGAMDKTREFCLQRVGKFFHQKEIEKWANLDWQGKRAGTTSSSIFVFAGGYNCRHSLIPVHDSIVPKEDLRRINEL